ncbi:MAG: ATP-grasp domain-containing protein, partial [Candidatus Omnitrophica bacterium]|nr:ATP-grasp domain-containing protein [Candidatus Omnitrophota bacterium]
LQFTFPAIIKPCFGFGSSGIQKIQNKDELLVQYEMISKKHKDLILQEFIPGNEILAVCAIVNSDNEYKKDFCTYWISRRPELRVFQTIAETHRMEEPPDNLESVRDLFKAIRYIGYANLQFKLDSRDNNLKLMEINPRFGSFIWMPLEAGINYPLINLNIHAGERIEFHKINIPSDTVFLCPDKDLIVLMIYFWCLIKKRLDYLLYKDRISSFQNLPSLRVVINDYKKSYFCPSKRFDLFVKNFISDPLVSICIWLLYVWRFLKYEYPRNFQQ